MSASVVDSKLNPGGNYTVQTYFGQTTLSTGSIILAPSHEPTDGAYVPYASVFDVVAYVSSAVGNTDLQLPNVAGMLLVNLPKGFGTPLTEIAAALFRYAKTLKDGALPGPFGIDLAPNPVVHYAQVIDPTPKQMSSGNMVLVERPHAPPFNQQFDVYALLGMSAPGPSPLAIPNGALVVSLPNGFTTPLTEIAAAIENDTGGGPPTGVDNNQ